MTTINVSLPEKLKEQAEALVSDGFYASFSDLVRDSLRKLVAQNKYDLWVEEAKEELKKGKAKVLKSKKDIDEYFGSL
jgi:Arc/MetJ-type ribon-helix-helix transcriptional regulator